MKRLLIISEASSSSSRSSNWNVNVALTDHEGKATRSQICDRLIMKKLKRLTLAGPYARLPIYPYSHSSTHPSTKQSSQPSLLLLLPMHPPISPSSQSRSEERR